MSPNPHKIKSKEKAKSMSSFDFSTLYSSIQQIPHKSAPEVIKFIVKSRVRKRISFSKTSSYRKSARAGKIHFTKKTFVNAMSFRIYK